MTATRPQSFIADSRSAVALLHQFGNPSEINKMSQPLRVLILEDQPSDAALVVNELIKSGFKPVWERVETEEDFLAKLDSAWDIILADYSLPQFDALRALRLLRQVKCQIPLIIVTGTIGEETAVAAMREGATDFILKDRLGRLGQAVTYALEHRRMREAQREAADALKERAHVIMLTADVVLALNQAGTLRDMLQKCAQSMVTNLDAALARVWTLNTEQNVLELEASAGLYTHLEGAHARVPVGAFKIGQIAQERAPHLTNDVLDDPRVSDPEWAKREGMVAFAGYPLIAEDQLVGVMAMFARHQLAQGSLDAMATVALQIAAGIERKRTEERLRFTQFTIDHVATPVLWGDAEGKFFNVNDAACHLMGYTRDELCSLHISDVDPNIPRERWPTLWNEMRQHRKLAMESKIRRKDGSEVPISVSSNLLQIDGREFSCTFLQDITERKQVEGALRQSEARTRGIVESAMDCIICIDAQGRITEFNPAAVTTFGYARDAVIGRDLAEMIIPPAFRDSHRQGLARFQTTGEGPVLGKRIEISAMRANGSEFPVELAINAVSHEGSTSFTASLRDLTERKHLEEQFRQSQKMEAIGRLAGGVAHDFNNLLTIILGYSDILKESLRAGDPLLESVDQIHTAGNRAAGLTRQLLAFSRNQVLAPVVLNLNTLLGDMEKMLGRLIGEDISLVFRPSADLWRVRVDAGQMEQIVMNLVVNSRDAMPQGGQLTLETTNVELDETYAASQPGASAGEHVLLGVTDTGCGMDRATRARIFEPFFSTKGDQGTGLGLATVYGIVKQSGGHVNAYSEPGHGTSFKIYLPRDTADTSPKASPVDSKTQNRGTETVLLVEDEEGVRSLARISLQRQGYKVLEARHGGEALLLCEQHQGTIDLLATDVVMPNMSGRELAERLAPLRPGLRVLYMSGYMDDAIVRHGLLYAEVPFLQKPYTPDALARKVREVLDRPTS
jgi:two-component system cell cycle sensor histidine kinase/response regulator CckA